MEKSRVRITCNPFIKKIEYEWYDFNFGNYGPLDQNSKLWQDEYVNATIQNRAYEIVEIIDRECNSGNLGLEIYFIGTERDYVDLCKVINTYFGEADITCIRDKCFYHTADEVMPQIKEKFALVKSTLEEYAEDDIIQLIDRYNDTVKPFVSLCVMGLYSAGKSAFINSMIGAEILPSSSDPTTAKVYKIYCDKKYQICFTLDEKKYVLNFEGKRYKPNSSLIEKLIIELQGIVKSEGPHNEIVHMNRALDIINHYKSSEHKISDVIEVRLPYRNTGLPTDEVDFVIYDTPGSNSDSNAWHFEVLKRSLDEQTNALPILVTTTETMDAEDNNKILSLIEGIKAFDTTNAVVIINKADAEVPEALRKKKEKSQELKISRWKSTRIFFVSSVIGMASKKKNPYEKADWFESKMFKTFKNNVEDFEHDGEMHLYEFNIIDDSKKILHDSQDPADWSKVLYRNSGLEAVEKEIAEYASKYALYNKCRQASDYLQEAIELCAENVNEAKSELDRTLQEVKKCFDEKERELCNKLEEKKKDITAYNTGFQRMLEKIFSSYTVMHNLSQDGKQDLQAELRNQWRVIKEQSEAQKHVRDWKFGQMQEYVYNKYNQLLDGFAREANGRIAEFWNRGMELFKKECIEIVHESDTLTVEQKKILESIVLSHKGIAMYRMEFDLWRKRAIRNKKFMFWYRKSQKVDFKACGNEMVKDFNDEIRKRIVQTVLVNVNNSNNWTNSLIYILTEELSKFNPELSYFHQQMKTIRANVDEKEKCVFLLEDSKEYIDGLLERQGGEEIA